MFFWPKSRERIIQNALPCVVSIIETAPIEKAEHDTGEAAPLLFPFGESKIKADAVLGSGSGFFVDPSGLLITSRHVIHDLKNQFTVATSDGAHLPATIVSIDPIDDIAILKVSDGRHPALKLGDSSRAKLGEEVIAIGNALGMFQNSVSRGIISGVGRAVTTKNDGKGAIQELRGLIQTDAAINTGNSGGPLINRRGEVIGVNTFVVAGSENLSFAVPINAAERDLEDIRKYGKVELPYLGVRYVMMEERVKKAMSLPLSSGALVTARGPHQASIVAGSPADHAGIEEKDILISCNSKQIAQSYNIQDILEEHTVGDVLKFRVARGNKELEIEVTLAERPRH